MQSLVSWQTTQSIRSTQVTAGAASRLELLPDPCLRVTESHSSSPAGQEDLLDWIMMVATPAALVCEVRFLHTFRDFYA